MQTAHSEDSIIARLLNATKVLESSFVGWSQGKATEGQVSDCYVQLGNAYMEARGVLTRANIKCDDLIDVPQQLRQILEEALAKPPSNDVILVYGDKLRSVMAQLFRQLKEKQSFRSHSRQKSANSNNANLPQVSISQPFMQSPSSPYANSVNTGHNYRKTSQQSYSSQQQQPNYPSQNQQSSNYQQQQQIQQQQLQQQQLQQQQLHQQQHPGYIPDHTPASPSNSQRHRNPQRRVSPRYIQQITSPEQVQYPRKRPPVNASTNAAQPQASGPKQQLLSPPENDVLYKLQHHGALERQASKRYSTQQLSKNVNGSPTPSIYIPTTVVNRRSGVPDFRDSNVVVRRPHDAPQPDTAYKSSENSRRRQRVHSESHDLSSLSSEEAKETVAPPPPPPVSTLQTEQTEQTGQTAPQTPSQAHPPPVPAHPAARRAHDTPQASQASQAPQGPQGPQASQASQAPPAPSLPAELPAELPQASPITSPITSPPTSPRRGSDTSPVRGPDKSPSKASGPPPPPPPPPAPPLPSTHLNTDLSAVSGGDGPSGSEFSGTVSSPIKEDDLYDIEPTEETMPVFLRIGGMVRKAFVAKSPTIAALRLSFVEVCEYVHSESGTFPAIEIQDPKLGLDYELTESTVSDVKEGQLLTLKVRSPEVLAVDDELKQIKETVKHLADKLDGKFSGVSTMPSTPNPNRGIHSPILASGPGAGLVSGNSFRQDKKLIDLPKDKAELVKRELAVIRQTANKAISQMKHDVTKLRQELKYLSDAPPVGDRGFIVQAKAKIDYDVKDLVSKIDDLSDVIDAQRISVGSRGIRYPKREMDKVRKELETCYSEFKKSKKYLTNEKPVWKKIWQQELSTVIDEQKWLKETDEVYNDFESDLKQTMDTFQLVCEANELPRPPNKGALLSAPPIKPGEQVAATNAMLEEISALNLNSSRRTEAVERAERVRKAKLALKSEEFVDELGAFVSDSKLKPNGGFEEVERKREERYKLARQKAEESEIEGAKLTEALKQERKAKRAQQRANSTISTASKEESKEQEKSKDQSKDQSKESVDEREVDKEDTNKTEESETDLKPGKESEESKEPKEPKEPKESIGSSEPKEQEPTESSEPNEPKEPTESESKTEHPEQRTDDDPEKSKESVNPAEPEEPGEPDEADE